MKIQIGAMSVGDILDRGLKILLARLPTYYLINLIVLLPVFLVELITPVITDEDLRNNPSAVAEFAGENFLTLLLLAVLQPIANAAILHIVAQEFVDQRASIGGAFAFALRHFFALFWASLLAGLTMMVGLVLCCAPFFIFLVWYIFVAQVVVVEGIGGTNALNRSKELTGGYRLRVFGLLVLFLLIQIIFILGVSSLEFVLPSFESVTTDAGVRTVANFRNHAIQVVVSNLLGYLIATYSSICLTLLYFDLRIRKEGFDLELAARQQTAPVS